ncbi:lipid asymmetry maintenance protein MlaB [Oceanispirochaeta sp.]|jgi:anti-anti-sigma factor|uniref:STAS domain-containing protein n=1 Tax=Oceanispirochaeta sp. TaxID=2035350 RepID=UPI002621DD5F|nr:STAS domain-containing protein [Oceanispirochaeta sp.]MDA3955886.1 STAS domain-containing protein [Oceanispirochaeta sp.]
MAEEKNKTVQFKGNLDIRQAESMHDILKKYRSGSIELILDLSGAEDIDFAIIQLLYSFKVSLKEDKRKVLLKGMNQKIADKIKLCDFHDLLLRS